MQAQSYLIEPSRISERKSVRRSEGPQKSILGKTKRRDLEHNMLDTVVQNLPRSNLLDCLEAHWETLKVEGIFAIPSRQVFTWTLEGNSEQVRRLHHHLILRHLDVEDDLHQWRRSIAEMRNLDYYASFFAEARAKHGNHKQTRQSGESNSADNGDSIPGLGLGLLLLICITVITLQDTLILI